MTWVDAHQHFWTPARGDYDWMPKDNPILNRVYVPADLAPMVPEGGRTVLVQAAATVAETEYMLGLADATPWIAGVVGWIDFERPEDRGTLERLSHHPKFLGVRPMIQDIPDVDWMLRADVQWGFQALVDLDLTFDALGFPRHLENFHTILTRYPQMRVVVDHGMKPQIRDHSSETWGHWANGMTRIAEETSAYVKLSGLVTEADPEWSVDALRPYTDLLFATFGPGRIMWGSDWPVCRLRAEYADWRASAQALTNGLTEDERARVFGETAAAFYRLA